MASVFDQMLEMAAKQRAILNAKSLGANRDIEAAYAPDRYQSAIDFQRAKTSEVPYDIAYKQALTSEIPSRIAQNFAAAAYNQAQTGRIPYLNAKDLRELRTPNYQSTWGKALADVELTEQMYGKNSPEHQDALAYANSLKMSAAGKGGGLNTYTDPATGETYSIPTKAQLTRLQKQVVANEDIQASLKTIVSRLGPYLGSGGRAKYFKDKALTFTRTGAYPDLEKSIAYYESGIDQTKTDAEKLLSEAGLSVTNHTVQDMTEVMKPRATDNPNTYAIRVQLHLDKLREEALGKYKRMGKGISLRNQALGVAPAAPEMMPPPQAPVPPPMGAAPPQNALEVLRREQQMRGAR